jgi:hypothetical protein
LTTKPIPLQQLIQISSKSNWCSICDKTDIIVDNANILSWKKRIIDYMFDRYVSAYARDPDNRRILLETNTRFNCTLAELINQTIPTRKVLQKGDLAEAVSCVCFEELFNLIIPYYKWANKNNPNMSETGVDVFVFGLNNNPDDDTLYVVEAKYRKSTAGLRDAITRDKKGVISYFKSLNDLKLSTELFLLLKRVENNAELYKRILNFTNRFANKPLKKIYNTAFFMVDSNVDTDSCVKLLTKVGSNPRPLKSFNHIVDDLEIVTYEVFRGIKDWSTRT